MATNDYPKQLWDFALVYEAEILSMIAGGRNIILGVEKITSDTVNITEYLDFVFWDLVWFGNDLEEEPCFRRWLGVSHCVGSALYHHVFKCNGSIDSRPIV